MKSSRIFAVIVVTLILTGCGWFDRKVSSFTGGASKTCVDGVTYLQFTSGAAVQVDRDGKPVPCNS